MQRVLNLEADDLNFNSVLYLSTFSFLRREDLSLLCLLHWVNVRIHEKCCWFTNSSLYVKGKERLKKESDHSRWAGDGFNKQGNLLARLALGGGHKMSRSRYLLTKILKVYI